MQGRNFPNDRNKLKKLSLESLQPANSDRGHRSLFLEALQPMAQLVTSVTFCTPSSLHPCTERYAQLEFRGSRINLQKKLMSVLKTQPFWYSLAICLHFERTVLVPQYLIMQFTQLDVKSSLKFVRAWRMLCNT